MSKIPELTVEALIRYLQYGISPGRGIRTILENNMAGCMQELDEENKNQLTVIYTLIFNRFPGMSYGSYNRVEDWITKPALREKSQKQIDIACKHLEQCMYDPPKSTLESSTT